MKIFFFLALLLALASCDDAPMTTRVDGKIINHVTGKPLEGVSIRLWRTPQYGGVPKIIETVSSDEKGEFSFNNTPRLIPYYNCELVDATSFLSGNSSTTIDINKFDQNNITFDVSPKAYLRLPVNNIHYVNALDEMGYRCYHIELGIQRFGRPNGGYDTRFGDYQDGDVRYNTPIEVPMGTYAFDWYVIRNGVKTTFADTLYLAAGQDTLYEINY